MGHAEAEGAPAGPGGLAVRASAARRDITTLSGAGAVIRASQVWRMPGLSWVGIQVRLRIAWPWLSR